MEIDMKQLVSDMKSAVSEIVKKDSSTISGFSERQLTGIASQAVLVAKGIASGDINDSNRDFFLDQLVELAHNFVRTLVGLMVVTIEKIWSAIVDVLWKAISAMTGIDLPAPNIA